MMRVVVIGAGPAGMAAAHAAAGAGVPVLLIDSEAKLGGQYHRQSATDGTEKFALPDGVEYWAESVVWAIEPIAGGHRVHVSTGPADGPGRVSRSVNTAALVLATGAHDRALPFPGWDLPGVVTAGAAQALAKGQGVAIGQRVLLSGTGPFLLPVAASLVDVGARVEAVLEANTVLTGWLRPGEESATTEPRRGGRHTARALAERDTTSRQPGKLADWSRQLSGAVTSPGKAAELAGYLGLLARQRIPYRSRQAVIAAHGDDRVEAATVAKLDVNWRVVPGSQRDVEVDAVCVGFGFTPQLELATAVGCAVADGFVTVDISQATSVAGVFAAGELTGIGGAVLSEHEGTVAGTAAAIALGARVKRPSKALRHIRTGRRFAAAMAAAYPVRSGWQSWLSDDTLVCRCEEVSCRELRSAVDEHRADGVRAVKLVSRAGLGRCQGRICGRNVAELAGLPEPGSAFARRPIAVPIRLAELAEADSPQAKPAELADSPETDSREGTA
ncbi:NAD(P)/FAD-dependent oxidoreductase [Stackebrandtia nassauensis]|uniref:BFD domain protein (2Fe-2S)-binding domain protein n=1 Tax=Stackebrandtia nassauensis (strain DSM 44728 / CIP 108903 / NRRL B-16338 / NBRC 102104 / LLR-40K-21) TaxID=446470 RepID=D3Q110_STANL|nr:NAD(P)/FAD-dependent oxidoreductase [Stackebrandtia nassauensis]ADD43760.1 BFD domain protein (2Fe-2S)-binding domain protein [Stackebrandtia nassauensis DSM 44728]